MVRNRRKRKSLPAQPGPPAAAQSAAQPHAQVNAAFALLRNLHPTAAIALVEPGDGDTPLFWLMAVRSATRQLLWFDEDNYHRHPDCDALGGSPELDLDREVIATVERLLYDAFTQPGATSFAPAGADAYQGVGQHRAKQQNLIEVTAPDHPARASA